MENLSVIVCAIVFRWFRLRSTDSVCLSQTHAVAINPFGCGTNKNDDEKEKKQHQTQHTYNTCTSTYIRIIVQQSNKMSISQQRKRKANERKQDKTETHQTEWMTEKGTFIEWNKKWTKYCGKQINTAQQSSTITTVYVRDSWKCAWLTALYKLLCSVRFALFGSTLSLIFLHLMRWPLLFCCALFSLCSFAICSLLHTITVIIAYTGHAALARARLCSLQVFLFLSVVVCFRYWHFGLLNRQGEKTFKL